MRRLLLGVLGAYHLALGAFMIVAPRAFFDQVATYGAYNDHYIRDNATFYVALGVTLLVAAGRASWRLPLLVLACVQYATHVLNHLWDVADTDPAYQGPVNAVLLVALGVLIAWLTKGAWQEQHAARRGGGEADRADGGRPA